MSPLQKSAFSAVVACAMMACIFSGVAVAGIILTSTSERSVLIGAATPLVIAIAVRRPALCGLGGVAGVFAGALAGLLVAGIPIGRALTAAIVTAGVVGFATWMIRTLIGRDTYTTTLRNFGIACGVMVGASALGALTLANLHVLTFNHPISPVMVHWFLGALLGIALVAPPALTLSWARLGRMIEVEGVSALGSWAGFACVTLYLTLAHSSSGFALALIPLMIAATRLKPLQMAFATSAFIVTGAATLLTGHVAGMAAFTPDSLWTFQASLAGGALLAFFGSLFLSHVNGEYERLEESEARHRRAMWDSVTGMANVSGAGKILDANPAYARMFGLSVAEIEGRNVRDLTFPADAHIGEEILRKVCVGEMQEGSFQKRFMRCDGSPFWVKVSFQVLKAGKADSIVLVSQVEDIDEKLKAEHELEELRLQWDFALASTGQGFWDYNSERDTADYSPSWVRMLGYEAGEIHGTNDAWLGMVHPDDRASVARMDVMNREGTLPHFEHEYRMRHKRGHWVWVLDRGKVVERNRDGSVRRVIGTLTDISERRAAEIKAESAATMLAGEKERLRVMLTSIGDAVVCTDADGLVTFMNRPAEELTLTSAADAVGKPLARIYRTSDEDAGPDRLPRDAGRGGPRQSKLLTRRDGSQRIIREIVSPIEAAAGEAEAGNAAGAVIVFHDFSDMRALQLELQHAALHDGLTGLKNRAGFMSLLEREAFAPAPDGIGNHLLFIDLDHFKAVNDGNGHAAGDELLKIVARTLKEAVRSVDAVARLGGDEFGVFLPKCPESFARLAAQVIVDSVAAIEFERQGRSFRVGASVGIATFAEDVTIDSAMARADEACYAAKAAGGGVVRATSDRPRAIAAKRKGIVRTSSRASS